MQDLLTLFCSRLNAFWVVGVEDRICQVNSVIDQIIFKKWGFQMVHFLSRGLIHRPEQVYTVDCSHLLRLTFPKCIHAVHPDSIVKHIKGLQSRFSQISARG